MKLFTFLIIFIYVLTGNIGQRLGIENKCVYYILLVFSILYLSIKGKLGTLFRSPVSYVILCVIITIVIRLSKGIMSDSFLVLLNVLFPPLLLFVIQQMRILRPRMQTVFINIFIINSLIAIFEFVIKSHIIGNYDSTYTEGYVSFSDSEFRSVALMGGPLANAEFTLILNAFLLFSNIKKKYQLFFLGTLAILAYNARTSFFMNATIFILYSIINFHNFSKKQKRILVGAMSFIVVFVAFIVFNTNMGSRLFLTEETDGGSIDVRLQLFDYAMDLDYKDFLFGMSYSKFQSLQAAIGVKVIENLWLNFIFHYGIIAVGYFTLSYYFVIKNVFANYKISTELILVLGIVIVMSSTNGLYSNYRSFLLLFICGYMFSPQRDILKISPFKKLK